MQKIDINQPNDIQQIIPAEGWYARYVGSDLGDDVTYFRLSCFALVSVGGVKRVVGMSGNDGQLCEETKYFRNYEYRPGEKRGEFEVEAGEAVGAN
ncbi:MAG: hypothetical protein QGF16_07695 [Rhodospirillales bacterium]|nr:hypothetical protein [Rhodospirillales bacterium]|tara:strand:+ start:208 stop:495 length:288 start_codon:yes stop_codon:yes gene_type:complete